MATKTLVIDGGDPKHFCLVLDDGTLRVGDTPAHPEGVVRDVRILRVRCEVELDVDDDRDQVRVDQPGVLVPSTLRPDSAVQLAHARLSLRTGPQAADPAPAPEPEPAPAAPAPATSGAHRRLRVIDGANQGQTFRLPDSGTVAVGRSDRLADIVLNDLYVSSGVHCSLTVEGDAVTVAPVEEAKDTLVDGKKVSRPHPLRPGSVLRIGNSHLRLEAGTFPDDPPPPRRDPAPAAGRSGILRPPPAPAAPSKPTDAFTALEGQVLGHYRLGRVLGRGFCGAVFRAADTNTEQPVAVKVIAAGFPGSPAELERFAQAVRSVQHVRHPNLVAPLGAGKAGPHCWLAREFVDGESAADVIARVAGGDKPSWTRAARVTAHLARALDCLHKNRLVHGNITPRNVLIGSADHAAKLADLGLTQALGGSQFQRAFLEKKLLAELPYLAPEQAEPGAFVDALADLYAVGAVAYALIAGRPPFAGDTPEETLDRIQTGRVVRPSSYYKKVPAAFDNVLLKLLAHAQEDRYPTAAALLADLEPLAQQHETKL